jgi:hypothetical protein
MVIASGRCTWTVALTTEVFTVPDAILVSGMGIEPRGSAKAHLWVIINNHMTPQFEVVEAGLLPGITRSLSTLIKGSIKSTLVATTAYTGKSGLNITYIDSGFDDLLKSRYGGQVEPGFNSEYMQVLYKYAYEKARSPNVWTHEIPLPAPASNRPRGEIARR